MNRLYLCCLILATGATLAFDFVGANFLRDTVQAAIYSKYGFFPIVSSIRGLFDIIAGRTGLIKNSEKLYNDWPQKPLIWNKN